MNVSVDDTSSHWRYWSKSVTCANVTNDETGWFQLAKSRDSSSLTNLFNHTTMWTNSSDARATLLFQGTAIYLYSAALGGGGSMDIQLDEGVSVRSINSQSFNIASPSSTLTFWETGLDPSVVHQLAVGLIGGSIINIDYVNITSPPPSVFPPTIPVGIITSPSPLPPCPSPLPPTAVPSVVTASPSSIPSPTPSNKGQVSPDGPSSATGVDSNARNILIGTIVGGFVALILSALLVLCLRRRRTRYTQEQRELLLKPPSPEKERMSHYRLSLGLWTHFVRESGSAMTTARMPQFRRSNQTIVEPWRPPQLERTESRGSYTMSMAINSGTGNTETGFVQPSSNHTSESTPLSATSSHFATEMFHDAKSDSGHTMMRSNVDEDEDLADVADMFIKYSGVKFDADESEEQSRTPFLSPVESSYNSHLSLARVRSIDFRRLTRESFKSIRSLLPHSRVSAGTISGRRAPRRRISHPNIRSGPGSYAQLDVHEDVHPMPELTFEYAPKKTQSPLNSPKSNSEGLWDEKTFVHDSEESRQSVSGTTTLNAQSPQSVLLDVKSDDDNGWNLANFKWPMAPAPVVTLGSTAQVPRPLPKGSGSSKERRTHVKRPSFGPREVSTAIGKRSLSESASEGAVDNPKTMIEEV